MLVSEFPPLPGGIGNHAYNLAKQLQNNNFEVTVIADQRDISEEERNFDTDLNFKVFRVQLKKLRVLMYFKRILFFFNLIRKNDLVIVSGKFPLWLGAIATFFFRKRFLAIIHGSEVNFTDSVLNKSINFSLKRYHKIIAVSHYTKQLVSHLNLKNITVIPNGFDNSKWSLNFDKVLRLEGNPSLLTVGNVTDRKGQLNVIKHLSELKKQFPDAHYHCVGFPTQKEDFLAIATVLAVEDSITFHGRATHGELEQFYKASDIFVMLSSETKTGDVEGFGIALIEANYFGLPTIGALGCGIEDAIDNYKSGILVNHSVSEAFISAVKEIRQNTQTFSEMSKQWALKHTWEQIIVKYIKVIES
nr:glycosyltransferase family 4 protein [Winogradskyella immobilis]